MDRLIKFRTIVEHDSNLYYVGTESANIRTTFPYSIPHADVTLQSSSAPVHLDDIIRIQVSVTTTDCSQDVWVDLFSGRINHVGARHSTKGTLTIKARDHAQELVYTANNTSYGHTNYTTGEHVQDLISEFCNRLSDASPSLIDTAGSTNVGSYYVSAYKKYCIDMIRDWELREKYGYRLSTVPDYNADGTLNTAYVKWEAIPSTVNEAVKAIEGSTRFEDAEFFTSLENLYNFAIYFGQTTSGGGINGTDSDATSQSSYDRRDYIDTDNSVPYTSYLSYKAAAIVDRYKDPIVSGDVTLAGTTEVEAGDLVYCHFPEIILEGNYVDGNYRVHGITQILDSNGWNTRLTVGENDISISDWLATITKREKNNTISISSTATTQDIDHSEILNSGTINHSAIDSHIQTVDGNPHGVTKGYVGLGNVTNDAQLKRADNDWNFSVVLPSATDRLLIEQFGSAKKQINIGDISHNLLDDKGSNTHAQIDSHISNTSNPHSVDKTDVGLGNVTNDAQITTTDIDSNELAAINGASSPSGGNVFATMNDVSGGGVPSGVICMWMGTEASIPSGWSKYTGFAGRFVIGENGTYSKGSTGGSATHTLTVDEIPSHRHWRGNDTHGTEESASWYENGHAYTDYAGGGNSHNNMPPYIAVFFIQKN